MFAADESSHAGETLSTFAQLPVYLPAIIHAGVNHTVKGMRLFVLAFVPASLSWLFGMAMIRPNQDLFVNNLLGRYHETSCCYLHIVHTRFGIVRRFQHRPNSRNH